MIRCGYSRLEALVSTSSAIRPLLPLGLVMDMLYQKLLFPAKYPLDVRVFGLRGRREKFLYNKDYKTEKG